MGDRGHPREITGKGSGRPLLQDSKALRENEEFLALRSTDPPPELLQRACDLAQAQCTLGEIAGTLSKEFKITLKMAEHRVSQMAEQIVVWCHEGRTKVRERLFRACTGDSPLARGDATSLELFGRQHLGYTTTGVDAKVRKAIEQLEKMNAQEMKPEEP